MNEHELYFEVDKLISPYIRELKYVYQRYGNDRIKLAVVCDELSVKIQNFIRKLFKVDYKEFNSSYVYSSFVDALMEYAYLNAEDEFLETLNKFSGNVARFILEENFDTY